MKNDMNDAYQDDLRQLHAHLIEVQPRKIATNRAPQVPYVVRL